MSDGDHADPSRNFVPPPPPRTADCVLCSDTLEQLVLAERAALRRYDAGQMIFGEGAPGDAAYYVRAGSVDIIGNQKEGHQRLLNHVRQGELFGEMALLDGDGRIASAVSRELCELIVIPRDEFTALLRDIPELSLWMLRLFSHRLRIMTRLVTQMEEVQAVNLKVLAGQDEERRRIGRDIHDGVAQSFVDHILRTQLAQMLIESDPQQTKTILQGLEESLRDGRDKLRELVYDLYPKELSRVGLLGAIERFLARITESSHLRVSFDNDGLDLSLPQTMEATLYCLVQEALNNVRRHADATNVQLDIRQRGKRFIVFIADDGRGFDMEATFDDEAWHKSYGLLSMQERTRLAGGKMEINSRPGKGTQMRFEFPIPTTG